jgi:hypothetical protein
VNVAVEFRVTLLLAGWVVMEGGEFTISVAEELVTLP